MSVVELHEVENTNPQLHEPDNQYPHELPNLDSSPVAGTLGSFSYGDGTSPDIDNLSKFEFTIKSKQSRHILGNSASGKTLHPKTSKKQEMPRSIFSSVIALPKLKQQEGHKVVMEQYKDKVPKTFQVPTYRGYMSEKMISSTPQVFMKKRIYDVIDSRYRMRNPLNEGLHLTWALTKRIEIQNGKKKLDIRNVEKLQVNILPKTEEEYIKVCVDVSAEEEPYDQEDKDFIGKNALKEYNRHYSLLSKIEAENGAKRVKNSLYTNILSGINRSKLMPLKMDIVKRAGNSQEINNKYL